MKFQSTSSARRTTSSADKLRQCVCISIHVLREEDDRSGLLSSICQKHFNPRPPRGGRLLAQLLLVRFGFISIHVLREEDDESWDRCRFAAYYFNPRPPRGGRLLCNKRIFQFFRFQSTSSARRTTSVTKQRIPNAIISIHVLREEDDHNCKNRSMTL